MREGLAIVAAVICALSLATASRAQTPLAPPAAVSDPAFEAAKRAFEALPEPDRRGIQDALIWTGDYKGVVDGGFGRGTRAAIIAYAKRSGLPDNGTLDAKGRAALSAAASSAKSAIGFATVRDARSGISISLPAKTLVKRTDTKTGSRWISADGAVSVETSQANESDGDLASLFDKLKDSTPTRRVTYKLLRPDFLVVSGEYGKTAYYTRMARGTANGAPALRGYTINFPAGAKSFENISVAVANSFDPFPGGQPPARVAGLPTAPGGPGTIVPPGPAIPSAPPIARPTVAASAIIVAPDRVASIVGKCDNPKVGSREARLTKQDAGTGLALFEVPGVGGRPLKTSSGPMDAGAAVIVLFQNPAGAPASPTSRMVAASGETLANSRVLAPLGETSAGGAVFDRTGALIGLVGARTAPTRVAGIVPQTAWPVIPASALAAFVSPATIAGTPLPVGATAADVAAQASGSIVTLVCDR